LFTADAWALFSGSEAKYMSYSHRKKIQIDLGSQVVANSCQSCYESMSYTLPQVLEEQNDYALVGVFRKVARGENP